MTINIGDVHMVLIVGALVALLLWPARKLGAELPSQCPPDRDPS